MKLSAGGGVWINMELTIARFRAPWLLWAALLVMLVSASSATRADFPAGPSPRISVNAGADKPIKPAWRLGQPAPALHVTDLSGQPVQLSSFTGKPVVLEFGSLTEPAFWLSAPSVNWLARKWRGKVQFLLVYQMESHPAGTVRALAANAKKGFNVTQPNQRRERLAAARNAKKQLRMSNVQWYVDGMRNSTALAYGKLPNMTFLIDSKGRLVAAWPWISPWQVQGAIQAVLAGKMIPQSCMSHGFTENSHPPLEFDPNALPPASPQNLARSLENAKVTRRQLAQLLPALTVFSSTVLKTRQIIQQLRHRRGQFNQDARSHLRHALKALKAAAAALRQALRHRLTQAQYDSVYASLDRGRLRRAFAPSPAQ